MKKLEENNDQEINDVQDTVDLKDLRADLETKLGDGKLWEDEGKYYYKPDSDKILYEVDFDTQDTEKWMQGAVKKPGALHESLGISKDKEIPMSLINSKIAELHEKSKGDKKLSASDKKLLERLIFAKNAKSASKDFTKNEEDSDSDDPLTSRTDSVDESCPLLKNKQKKEKSAENMKKVEKSEDMYDKEKEDETVQDDDEKEKTVADSIPEIVEEDMKKEEKMIPQISPEEIKNIVADLVQKEVNRITKDFQEREEKLKAKTVADLIEKLQEEPYGYSKEYLEGKTLEKLEDMKATIEGSKLYEDFMKSKETIEDSIEINKEIFNKTEDFTSMGGDPWASFKSGTIRKGE